MDKADQPNDYIRLRYLTRLGFFPSTSTTPKITANVSKSSILDALITVCNKISKTTTACHPYINLILGKPVAEKVADLKKPVQQFLKYIESLSSVKLPDLVPDPAGSSRITHTGYTASQKDANPAIYLLGQAFQYFLDNHQTHEAFDDFNGIFQTIIHTHKDKAHTGAPMHQPKL